MTPRRPDATAAFASPENDDDWVRVPTRGQDIISKMTSAAKYNGGIVDSRRHGAARAHAIALDVKAAWLVHRRNVVLFLMSFCIGVILSDIIRFIVSSAPLLRIRMLAVGFDPYSVLGIDHGTDPTGIKKAFRRLSLIYHPEKNTDWEGFEKISMAYHVLTADESCLDDWSQALCWAEFSSYTRADALWRRAPRWLSSWL